MPTASANPITGTGATTARANAFVGVVTVLASALAILVWLQDPNIPPASVSAVLLLLALAIMGEAWQYVLPSSGSASIAFIPYAAMALVVPHWLVLAAVALAKIADGCFGRRPFVRALFNVGQFVAMFSCTILAYKALGGTAFLDVQGE